MFVDTSGLGRGGGGKRGRRKPPKLNKKQNKQNNSFAKSGSDYNRFNAQFPERTFTEETYDIDNT